jgi:hypothetical protein
MAAGAAGDIKPADAVLAHVAERHGPIGSSRLVIAAAVRSDARHRA